MSRPDPNVTLASRHAAHRSPQLGCSRCMRAGTRADTLPRWSQPRTAGTGTAR